jgi:hypothetical protein
VVDHEQRLHEQRLPELDPAKIRIEVACPKCGTAHTIIVFKEDVKKYQQGALIQDAFPYMDRSVREMLISGLCSECWDKLFKKKEKK